MGLLDELRAKSEEQRTRDEDTQDARAIRDALFRKQVRPRFRALYNYLLELVEHLNYLKAEVKTSYTLPGSPESFVLCQQDYSITVDSSDNLTTFNLRYRAVGPRPILIRVEGDQNPEKLMGLLREHHLVAAQRTIGARYAQSANIVEVTADIPVSFTFKLDPDNNAVTITTMNFPAIGNLKRSFDADEINKQWMEDIGDMLVRKKDIISELPISEEERQRIKAAIKEQSQEEVSDWKWYSRFKKDSHA